MLNNKIIKTLFCMQSQIIVMILFASVLALATFIENDYGPLGVKSFVYGQTWFELIMLVLTLGVIFNIIWFKMYRREKFWAFLIHISFVFIFVGSALTRYLGYEATMTIDEGKQQNIIYSLDDFIQLELNQNDKKYYYDKKILMTALNQTDFSHNFKLENSDIKVEFKKYIPNAIEKIVDVKGGVPMVNIIVSTMSGLENIDLEKEGIFETPIVTFSLNKKAENNNKPVVSISTKDGAIFFSSNITINWYSPNTNKEGRILANKEVPISLSRIYKVGQTEFMIKEASVSGALKIIELPKEQARPENQIDVILVDVIYKDKIYEDVALFKSSTKQKSFSEILKLDENTSLSLSWGNKEIELPFAFKLIDFQLDRYPGSNSPSSYSSDIQIVDENLQGEEFFKIFMNNTLDYKGYRFFQSSYKPDESATILSVNKDPGKLPTYIGYTLLFMGLIFVLFSKHGRFMKLSKTKYSIESIKNSYYAKNLSILFAIIFLISFQTPTFANNDVIKNIDKNHSDYFGSILVQDYQGRIKPLNSLAIEITNKVSRSSEILGLDANQFFLSTMLYPQKWQNIDFIAIKNNELKELVGTKNNKISYRSAYDENGNYKLEKLLEEANAKKPSERSKFDNELIKLDEKINIVYALFNTDFFKVFPIIDDKKNRWVNYSAIRKFLDGNPEVYLSENEATNTNELLRDYFITVQKATEDDNYWKNATQKLQEIEKYQKDVAYSSIIPNDFKVKAELIFNKYDIFDRLTPFYLILGLVLLITVFVNIFRQNLYTTKLTKTIFILFIIGFIIHTFGLALRWYIGGYAPWSNGYETMIYVAWAIVLAGILFAKQSNLALATTGVLSGITLFVAHLSWLEPQITTLAPVLKSYWLTIHVSVITASYGFLALSSFLGGISLILFIFLNKKKENDRFFRIILSIKESNRINEMSIMIGLVFLIIGNFLGGIWANESWGRYWGWDPKETWTLVSILVYAIIIHLKYVKGLLSHYLFSVLSLISYASIVMTYFGVNYYLSGKHSYAAGDPIPIPTFVPVSIVVVAILILLSFRNRKIV